MSDFDLKAATQLPGHELSARIWVISDIQQSAPTDALRGPDESALEQLAGQSLGHF